MSVGKTLLVLLSGKIYKMSRMMCSSTIHFFLFNKDLIHFQKKKMILLGLLAIVGIMPGYFGREGMCA